MDEIELSIIIPCYNVSRPDLMKCLDSIDFIPRMMTCEVWVVDDGSRQDVVCGWIEELNKPWIHAIRQPNMGPGGARNTGIEHSRGRYLTFLDADDYIFYGPYVHILRQLIDKQPGILCHGCSIRYEGSAISFMMEHDICPSCCSYIIDRNVLGDLRFTPHIYHEDEEFCTRLHLRRGHLVTSLEQAYYYRFRQNSITHCPDIAHIRKRFRDFITVLGNLQSEEVITPHDRALNRRIDIMSMCYIVSLMSDTKNYALRQEALADLRQLGLYPLRNRFSRGFRYWLISRLTCTPFLVQQLAALFRFLLKEKKEDSQGRSFVVRNDRFTSSE